MDTATEDLAAAVARAVHHATDEHATATGLTITEYIVIAGTAGWNDDGDQVSQVIVISDGAEHRVIGLIEHARLRMHADVLADPDDET